MNPIRSLAASLHHPISIPRDILHTWSLKEYTVHLFIEENILKCQMIDHSGREVYKANIDVPANYTLEKMIANLKQCKIILKNQVPNFRLPVNTWHLENKDVHLLPDTDHLLWNIVEESNTEDLLFPFQEVTIPSERCHLETVALIEKIKTDSLNRTYKNYLKTDFHVVRVLTPEEIPEEIKQNEKIQLSLLDNHALSFLERYWRGYSNDCFLARKWNYGNSSRRSLRGRPRNCYFWTWHGTTPIPFYAKNRILICH